MPQFCPEESDAMLGALSAEERETNPMIELESWGEEKRSSYLYRVVSDAESGTPRQVLFLELAAAADRQAAIWEDAMVAKGIPKPPAFRPDMRTQVVAALVRWLGPRRLRGVLAAMKVRGMSLYTKADPGHGSTASMDKEDLRHKAVNGGGNLRAAVFGANDGLVSNASLILGVAGATADGGIILLSGIAGLLAGAFSMAAGEYVSVRSQREMFEYQIGLERDELEQYPAEEAAELALIFEGRGMTAQEAKDLADRLIADPDKALDTLAREELGLNPEELGSPWGAALSSFFAFSIGALVPLLPFFFSVGKGGLAASIGLTALALFGVGVIISLFTGRHAVMGGMRMLAIGSAAGAATYLIGRLLGVAIN